MLDKKTTEIKTDEIKIEIRNNNTAPIFLGDGNSITTQKAPHIIPKNLASTLTPTLEHFVGRELELHEIEQRLKDNSLLLLLNGIGGIGKSTLASYYFHHHKDRFDYHGYVQVNDAIKMNFQQALTRSLDLENETLDECFEEAINKLSNLNGTKLLVIDDLMESPSSPSLKAVLGLCHYGFTLLFTSRTLFSDIPHRFVEHLPLPQAKELFGKYYRKPIDEAKLESILTLIDSHTLLIELIAKIMYEEGYTFEQILTQCTQGEMVTIAYTDDEGRLEKINDVLNRLFSLQNLSDEYLLLLKKFVILPSTDLPFEELSTILGETTQGRLNFLVKRGWLMGGEESYKLHPILHAYLFTNTPPTMEEIAPQFAFMYNTIGNTTPSDDLSTKNRHFPYFDAMAQFLIPYGNPFMNWENIAVKSRTLSFLEKKLSHYRIISYWITFLSKIRNNKKYRDALIGFVEKSQNSELSFKDMKNFVIQAKNYQYQDTLVSFFFNQLGRLYDSIGAYDHALEYYEKSLAIYQAIGDKRGEGATLNNISQIYDARGDLPTALTYLEKSLAIYHAIGDKRGEGATLNNISQIYDARGDLPTALTYLEKSLAIYQAIGDKRGEGATLNNISQIYKARGDLTTALTYLEKSLAIHQAIGYKEGEGVTLNNIGKIYDARGDLTTALTYLEQSLAIRQAIGDKRGEGTTLNNIGHIHWANDDHEKAIQNWVEAYRIAKKIENAQLLNVLEEWAKQLGHDEGLGLWEELSRERP